MLKYYRNIIRLIGLAIFLCLSACAYNSPSSSHNAIDFSPGGPDPDGDGDSKGYLHFPEKRPAKGRNVFIFDPNVSAWALYDASGHLVNTGRASGGRDYCPDVGRPCRTITGIFRVYNKGDADCISSKYPLETDGGAPMPYCMHFNAKGYAVHGSYDVPDYNASHGCIRVTPIAAQWLNTNYMNIGSYVVIEPYH